MAWLTREPEVRIDLRERFPWARSVIVVVKRYGASPRQLEGLAPFVASYALEDDYHDVMLPPLKALAEDLGEGRSHAYVDTGPALERKLAAAAGLGWTGKNTLLLNARRGSRTFLGVIVSELDFEETPQRNASCGTCTACQTACPTDAFVEPGVLDARKCISYLTIEYRGMIPRELRPAMGQWLFGCDLCQTCCPFEMNAHESNPERYTADALNMSLTDLLALGPDEFRFHFRRTPFWRPRREGLLRNAVIVVANGEHRDALPAVRRLLQDDSPILVEVASWGLMRLRDTTSAPLLEEALARPLDPTIRELLREDLGVLGASSS
jgi:epoxyqueuosine reductase